MRLVRALAGSVVALGLVAGGLLAERVTVVAAGLPADPTVETLAVSPVVLDRNGLLLRPFATREGRWRLPVRLDEVDPRYVAMLLAYEDRRFRSHGGVDWLALLRAAGQWLGNREIVSGGSTITMQVARLIEGRPTRSLPAKLAQIVHARRLEARFSKDEILTLYFMLAPFGGNLEGVRAASLAYFGKEPGRLTTAEAALLVALPQSPEARRPDADPASARAARDRVLQRLVTAGALPTEEATLASGEAVPTGRRAFPLHAAHLAEEKRAAHPDARQIRLTLDRPAQVALEALAAERASALGPGLSVAVVVADHRKGEIRASVGSPNLFDERRDGHVDMTRAVRSPGSTLKPLIYGLAFELGLAHPETLIEDRPTGFGAYVPTNFDGESRGTVTVREALQWSLNVPAVAVLDAVGPARLVARLRRAGASPVLPELSAPGLAVGLGGAGVTLTDLVRLYAAIARDGEPADLSDEPRERTFAAVSPVLSPAAAWQVRDILAGIAAPEGRAQRRVGYKTGTSYGYRDAWAIGFDGRHVIGVWVGRPDGVPVPGLTGAGAAAPLLFDAFARLGGEDASPVGAAPDGALVASGSALPRPLRRFRFADRLPTADPAPVFAFPRGGVHVDLGIGRGRPEPLVVSIRDGAPPFTWLANGKPIGRTDFEREQSWQPDGPGFVTISVIDRDGRSDRVTLFVE